VTDIHVISGESLDQEAAITIADVLAAHSAWLADSPTRYRHLLDATAVVAPMKPT
jgi:hypothetical protein